MTSVQRFSPSWLRQHLERIADGTFAAVLKALGRGRAPQLFLVFVPLVFVGVITSHPDALLGTLGNIEPIRNFLKSVQLPTAAFLLIASIVRLFVSFHPGMHVIFGTGFLALMTAGLWKTELAWDPFIMFLFCGAIAILLQSTTAVPRRMAGRVILMGFVAAFGLLMLLPTAGLRVFHFHRPMPLFLPERMILIVVVFWSEWTNVNLSVPLVSWRRFGQLFSPAVLVFPLPLPSHCFEQRKDDTEIRLQGLFDLTVCGVALFLFGHLRDLLINYSAAGIQGAEHAAIGALRYLVLFLKSFWILRFATGLLRWIGADVKDGFNYALLATSPMDRWKRWNTYYNDWLREFIFFPIAARTKSLFIAVFASFLLSFFLHSGSRLLSLNFIPLDPEAVWLVRDKLIYYLLQGFLVYIAARLPQLWPDANKRVGWFGVLGTVACMTFVHWLTFVF